MPYTVMSFTENVTSSSTHEAGAVAGAVCPAHPATPIPATISAALVSLASNLAGIIGTRQSFIGDDGKQEYLRELQHAIDRAPANPRIG